MRIELESLKAVPGNETSCLQHLVVELSLDRSEGDHRRLVARGLEDAAEKAGDIAKRRAGPLHDARQNAMGQIGVRTSEIEDEIDRDWHAFSPELFAPRASSVRELALRLASASTRRP